jgi:hypothetical protein
MVEMFTRKNVIVTGSAAVFIRDREGEPTYSKKLEREK